MDEQGAEACAREEPQNHCSLPGEGDVLVGGPAGGRHLLRGAHIQVPALFPPPTQPHVSQIPF